MSSYFGIGIMSGNSLDGLDLCHAEFMGMPQMDVWSYKIVHTKTVPFEPDWQDRFRVAHQLSGLELMKLHTEFGHYVGSVIAEYLKDNDNRVDFVTFMGHSAFHQPHKKLTFSLGDGETIASYLNIPLVTNIGSKDVALGGQGRPLLCFGDRFLYQNYNYCLNLGGQAYISCYDQAFDICPCNMLLNYLAHKKDCSIEFDEKGELARKGELKAQLLSKLNALPYYQKPMPKALCREWFDGKMVPIFEQEEHAKIEDLMHTAVCHIVQQVAKAVDKFPHPQTRRLSTNSRRRLSASAQKPTMLITGGGARNTYLMEQLQVRLDKLQIEAEETDDETIDFKEALIAAFLGMRCLLGLPNVSKDMTGSQTDSVSGSIHLPPNHSLPASFMFHS